MVSRKTCPKTEYLEIDDRILELAMNLLSSDEIQQAEIISLDLTKKSTRINAQRILKKMLGIRPKRPIYYTYHEINHLPHWTRYAVEGLGSFIDILVKCVASEKLSNQRYYKSSFNSNLEKLKNKLPNNLYLNLKQFNDLIYTPAKHVFSVRNRHHYFTSKEVVFTLFMTLKLKEQLVSMSKEAMNYVNDTNEFLNNNYCEVSK